MTSEHLPAATDLNAEALDVLRSLVTNADSLPETWRSTMLALLSNGIPRDLAPLEALITSTREQV